MKILKVEKDKVQVELTREELGSLQRACTVTGLQVLAEATRRKVTSTVPKTFHGLANALMSLEEQMKK